MKYPLPAPQPVDHSTEPEVMAMVEIAAEITTLEARYQLHINTPAWAAARHKVLSVEYADRTARRLRTIGGPFSIGENRC